MSIPKDAIQMEMFDDNLAALVEVGGYDSERELLRVALEALIDAKPELRLEMAISLWRHDKITLGRAAEIAQIDRESLKDELAARGLNIVIDVDSEDILKVDERIRKLRHANDSK